jgi:hypothetical protein
MDATVTASSYFNHGWPQRGGAATEVAQNCILLYRGFAIRRPWPDRTTRRRTAPSRIQFGDTADFKSALRRRGTLAKSFRRKTKFSLIVIRTPKNLPARNRPRFIFVFFVSFVVNKTPC